MSFSETFNSSLSVFNPVKSIPNEFIFSSECDFNSLIFSFFKSFSIHVTLPQSKINFDPKIYDAKSDLNIAIIYEKDNKLYIKSGKYENEFDDFFTKVNRHKEQKRKIRQSLKNGSLIYEVPLFKTLNLTDLNGKVYEDTIFSREFKYDFISSVFYPMNEQKIKNEENIIFKLNQNSKYYSKGALVVIDNDKEKIESNELNEEMNIKDSNDNKLDINKNDSKENSDDVVYFNNNEIMIEITKYDNFIEENISLFLLNLSNNQNDNNSQNINNNINTIEDIIKSTNNIHILDTLNHFNNIFTPESHNKFSLYKNIKVYSQSQILNEINSVFDITKEEKSEMNIKNNKLILDEDECDMNLINDIKKYFDDETIKEINKDVEITQNFTHFYIEGNNFNKENMKKIISFLNKENFYMFAWTYNKEQTKKFGIINNIMKVANLSNKIWFYINTKKSNEDIQL